MCVCVCFYIHVNCVFIEIDFIIQATFIPSFVSALDTGYFTSRYTWNASYEHGYAASETEYSSDNGSISGGTSFLSNRHDEIVINSINSRKYNPPLLLVICYSCGGTCQRIDEYGGHKEVGSQSCVNYSFSNFSLKVQKRTMYFTFIVLLIYLSPLTIIYSLIKFNPCIFCCVSTEFVSTYFNQL